MSKEKSILVEVVNDKKEIAEICEATRLLLKKQHNIDIVMAGVVPTIVDAFMHVTMEYLRRNKPEDGNLQLNILDHFTVGLTQRDNEEAEKEGNIVPYVLPGVNMKIACKNDDETEE